MIAKHLYRSLLAMALAGLMTSFTTGCASETFDEEEDTTSSSQTRADEQVTVDDGPSPTSPIQPAPAPGENEIHHCVSCGPGPQPWSDKNVINVKKTR